MGDETPRRDPVVGWLGLGKLGLPCAAAVAVYGDLHVVGHDPQIHTPGDLHSAEPGVDELLDVHPRLEIVGSAGEVVAAADVVFVAVQTPHAAEYDGSRPMPETRRDFDYTALRHAVRSVAEAACDQRRHIHLVVVSTVLPGTIDREIRPLLNPWTTLVYNPFFIAMGSTVHDFLHPAFVLIGADPGVDVTPVEAVYAHIHDAPLYRCSIPSAELVKVAYNTFISAKIAFANTLMEICHGTAADVDEVTGALALATDRVVSSKYMSGGMGDGGACHPRDLIAMGWLAERLKLSFDLFAALIRGREAQTRWLAELAIEHATLAALDTIVVLGRAYKADVPLCQGSPAALLAGYLDWDGKTMQWDPYVDELEPTWTVAVYVVATRHDEFASMTFPPGSVVIDPWRYIPRQSGVTVIHVGSR